MINSVALTLAFIYPLSLSAADLGVTACVAIDGDSPALHFEIQNKTASSISIPSSNFPWREDGAIVIAYRGDALIGKVMKRAYQIQDSVSGNVVLRSGEKQAGELVLKYLYPEIVKLDDRSSVTILWAYTPRGYAAKDITLGGALTLRDKDRCTN